MNDVEQSKKTGVNLHNFYFIRINSGLDLKHLKQF